MRPAISIYPTSPDTERSTRDTIALMHQCIERSYDAPAVIAATREALQGCGRRDPAWRIASAIWEWVHRHIRFISDEQILTEYLGLSPDLELLQEPALLLQTREGDCDCFTMLVCSMLRCAGVRYRIVTIAANPAMPDRWSHVYPVAISESGRELPMDASHGRYFGWQAPRYFRRQEWAA
jgi:transglutaminase-like putative cysteine protease